MKIYLILSTSMNFKKIINFFTNVFGEPQPQDSPNNSEPTQNSNNLKKIEIPESESDKIFFNALEEKNIELILGFLHNEYEPSVKNREAMTLAVLEPLSRSFEPLSKYFLSKEDKRYFSPFTYNQLTTFEFTLLYAMFNYNFTDDKFISAVTSNESLMLKMEVIATAEASTCVLKNTENKITTKTDAINYLSEIYKEEILKTITRYRKEIDEDPNDSLTKRVLKSKEEDLESLKNKAHPLYRNLGMFLGAESTFIPLLTRHISNRYHPLKPERVNNKYHFHNQYSSIYMLRDPSKIEEVNYVNKEKFNTLSSEEIISFIKTIFIRAIEKEENFKLLINASLKFKTPALFTYLNNLTHTIENREPFTLSVEQLAAQSKNLDYAKNNYTHYYKGLYQYLLEFNNLNKSLILERDPLIIKQKLDKKEFILSSIEKMKEDKFRRKILTTSTEDIINSSILHYSTKAMMLESINIAKELTEFPDVGVNEKHFLSNVENSIINVLELQFAFSTNNDVEVNKYQIAAKEQLEVLLNAIYNIRDEYNQSMMNGINDQIQDLILSQTAKKKVLTK